MTRLSEKIFSRVDSGLLYVVFALMGLGLVFVYSSSYIFASEKFGSGLYFFKKQFLFLFLGLLIIIITSFFSISLIKKFSAAFWVISVGLLGLTFIPQLSVTAGGATRWISLPMGLNFEPSELFKIAYVLLLCLFVQKPVPFYEKEKWFFRAFLLCAPLILLLRQPDFGTFFICVSLTFIFCFVFGLRWSHLFILTALALPVLYWLVFSVDYRRQRVLAFLDPWSVSQGSGFQVIQSMLSMHAGGIFGVGLGQAQGKLFFLPEAHTDFILSIIGEEIGFVGLICVFLLYAYIIVKGLKISFQSNEIFIRALSLGLTCLLFLSFFTNTGVALGLLPTKGLTLPFLSYGGSSIVVSSFLIGLLMVCSYECKKSKTTQGAFDSLNRAPNAVPNMSSNRAPVNPFRVQNNIKNVQKKSHVFNQGAMSTDGRDYEQRMALLRKKRELLLKKKQEALNTNSQNFAKSKLDWGDKPKAKKFKLFSKKAKKEAVKSSFSSFSKGL